MSSHPSHHSGPPRLSDSGSMGYPGPSSYQHPPPPPPSQHHQHQHQQPQPPPPPPPPQSTSLNSPAPTNHHYSSYPSQSSQSIGSHHGPGNPGMGVSDLYRPPSIGPPPPPPPSSNNTIPSLPSMRTIDALPPPSSSNMHSSPYAGAPPTLPPGPLPYFSMPPPYGIQPQGLPSFSSYGHHHHGHMNDLRMPPYSMGGLRHKKEIKRRTKTGCMTCRKRRIKCDETHPTCNNCKKSKRDCAGYDPIFKQQPNNPAFLQATAHVPPHNGSATAASTTTTTTSTGRPNSPPPAPYSASTTASSTLASTASPLANIKSPSILSGPSSHSSAPSSSGSAASNYYSATGPSSSSSNSSYQSNTNGNAMSNGNSSVHHHNSNGYSSHTSTSSSFNPSTYSSRSIVSPHEYSGSSYDAVGSSFKDEPRRDYWADRAPPRPAYASSTFDSRDLGRYGQGLL